MKAKVHHWWDELYKTNIILIAGRSELDVCTWIQADKTFCFDLIKPESDLLGMCQSGTNGFMVYVKDEKDILTLHHECIHLATKVMESRGIEDRSNANEAICYYSELWFTRFIKALKIKVG
jgi:hypothetical protein